MSPLTDSRSWPMTTADFAGARVNRSIVGGSARSRVS
jgi:hypothetical protein